MSGQVYLDGHRLPMRMEKISHDTPTASNRHNVLETGDVEILHGDKLRETKLAGILPEFNNPAYAEEWESPRTWMDRINKWVEEKTPVRLVYTGLTYDVNMLVSVQSPKFTENGGSGNVEYSFIVREWVEVKARRMQGKSVSKPRAGATSTTTNSASGAGGAGAKGAKPSSFNIANRTNLDVHGEMLTQLEDRAAGNMPSLPISNNQSTPYVLSQPESTLTGSHLTGQYGTDYIASNQTRYQDNFNSVVSALQNVSGGRGPMVNPL